MKPSDIPVIESKLGPALSSDLKSTTEHIVKFVDEDITSLEELYPRLHAAVTRMYPDQEFVTINFGD